MKRLLAIWFLCTVCLFPLVALPEGVSFVIRYYDKDIFYPGSATLVQATVTNDSAMKYRFRMADSRVFTIEFIVSTPTNTELPHAQNFIIERNVNQPVFYRDIFIQPGESFSFIEDVSSYVDIRIPGTYYLRAVFYPELSNGPNPERAFSNTLPLSVRSPSAPSVASGTRPVPVPQAVLQRQTLSPDQVVDFTIRSRQLGDWDGFFLYLDVEGLLLRDPERARRYGRLSQSERANMLEEYARMLTAQTADGGIVLQPSQYQIIKTSYTPEEGTVQVVERFRNPTYTDVRLYTYYLHKRDEYWLIYNYEVRNLGTE